MFFCKELSVSVYVHEPGAAAQYTVIIRSFKKYHSVSNVSKIIKAEKATNLDEVAQCYRVTDNNSGPLGIPFSTTQNLPRQRKKIELSVKCTWSLNVHPVQCHR